MKNRKKLVPVAVAFVMFAFLAATSFFIILSVRLTLSPREILRNIEYVPDTNVVAEVVERDPEAGEVHMVFYYDANGEPGLAAFRSRWTGYELTDGGTTDNWRCFLWSKDQGIARYIVWGVCEEDITKVWLDDPVNEYAKVISTGDRYFWYALTDMVVSSNEAVVLIP